MDGLQRGRSKARETEPVRPVAEAIVNATRPFLSRPVEALIDLQLLTGARPGELCILRECDLDMSGRIWVYRPEFHKTTHRGLGREIYLGPKAQEIVKPFFKPFVKTSYLFSPQDADTEHQAERRENPTPWGYSPYDDIIKKLVAHGIPREQIAAIGDAESDAKKQALFEKVRNGSVRVLIGSTQKMGTGTNARTPGCPASSGRTLETGRGREREGRILRQATKTRKWQSIAMSLLGHSTVTCGCDVKVACLIVRRSWMP